MIDSAAKLAYLLAIVAAVTFLVAAMLDLMPGDPAYAILGESATPDQIERLHDRLNLDKHVFERYWLWISGVFSGDLGESVRSRTPALDAISRRWLVTLEIVVGAQLFALAYAVPTAIYGAYRSGGKGDRLAAVASFGAISIPHFVLALVVILVFAAGLGWFPVGGFTPLSVDPAAHFRALVLPWFVVAAVPAGVYQRLLRSDLGATLQEDYIAMAEAKGLSPTRIMFRHALRPSLFSLATVFGLTTAQLLGGTVVIESIFGLPGLGRLLLDSIEYRDIPMIQAIVAMVGIGYVLINGAVDLMYGVLDPRVRRRRS